MSLSSPFIKRPVATTLLTVAVALAGAAAFRLLPLSPLPQVDFPTISVNASLAGASPEIMASSVATPLERQFGRIAGVTEMTSSSSLGQTGITLQFDLSRNIDSAARDVQGLVARIVHGRLGREGIASLVPLDRRRRRGRRNSPPPCKLVPTLAGA